MFYNLKRLYINKKLEPNELIFIDDAELLNRLKNVLRVKQGSQIRVFNENDGEFLSIIKTVKQKEIQIFIESYIERNDIETNIDLLLPIIKPDRMRWMVEKATEIGARRFIFYNADRAQKHHINIEKINHYIVSACEQCERTNIPKIEKASNIEKYIAANEIPVIFCNEREKEQDILNLSTDLEKGVSIIVGPEGGFTDKESTQILSLPNVNSVHLGKSILRTETAALYALSVVHSVTQRNIQPPRASHA